MHIGTWELPYEETPSIFPIRMIPMFCFVFNFSWVQVHFCTYVLTLSLLKKK